MHFAPSQQKNRRISTCIIEMNEFNNAVVKEVTGLQLSFQVGDTLPSIIRLTISLENFVL